MIINSWNKIPVERYLEIRALQIEDYKNTDDFYLDILSILYDISSIEIQDWDYDFYTKALLSLNFISKVPIRPPSNSIQTEAGELFLINDLYTISLGEFIDLEFFFCNDYNKNFTNILAILYRVKNVNNSLLYLDTFEPYGDWIYHRSNLFNSTDINDVYGVINKYLDFRNKLLEQYSGLFENVDNSEIEITENMSVIEKSEIIKENRKNQTVNKWSWDIYLLKLANGDPTRIKEATALPLVMALNVLSMQKELNLT